MFGETPLSLTLTGLMYYIAYSLFYKCRVSPYNAQFTLFLAIVNSISFRLALKLILNYMSDRWL